MLLTIIGAVARRRSLRANWRLCVAGRIEVDSSNTRPLRPIPKGTLTLVGQTCGHYSVFMTLVVVLGLRNLTFGR